jgi:hypothetical protein
VVTTFEYAPEAGVRYSKIVGLVDDLCMGLKAESIRIDRIPGRSTVGIEVPNRHQEVIFPRELLASDKYRGSKSKLTLAFGKDIDFKEHPDFSSKYYLRAEDEDNIRRFFRDNLIGYLTTHSLAHVESQRSKLLIYEKRETLSAAEIVDVLAFVEGFVNVLNKVEAQPVYK